MSDNGFWGDDGGFQQASDEYFAFTQTTKDADLHPVTRKKSGGILREFFRYLPLAIGIGLLEWLLTEGVTWFTSLFR